MKKVLIVISVSTFFMLTSCVATVQQAKIWLDSHKGQTGINISGYWFDKKFGVVRLIQKGSSVIGYCDEFGIDGAVNYNKLYIAFFSKYKEVVYTAILQLENKNLKGKYTYGISKGDKGLKVFLEMISQEDFNTRIKEVEYNPRNFNIGSYVGMYSPKNEFGNKWLEMQKGKPGIDINGSWKSDEWGDAHIKQEGGLITGDIGGYKFRGVLNGTTVYMIIFNDSYIYYSAIAERKGDRLVGYYYRGFHFNHNYKRIISAPLVLMKRLQ